MYSLVLILFLVCVLAILHSYLFYPLLLFLLSGSKKKDREFIYSVYEDLPEVTLVIAAYNEEKVIGEKIRSVLESGYPEHKIEILIGSDASTDKTNEIVKSFAAINSNIRLIEFEGRSGKIKIVNRLVDLCTGEVLILTDANVFFEKGTVYHLAKHFKDPRVGQVCANIIKISDSSGEVARQEKNYLDFENKIKLSESILWDFVIGAEGGCNAVRRDSFTKVPENFCVDDFFTSMSVIEKGQRIIFEKEAMCIEDVTSSSAVEFARKVRISTGNFQNLSRFKNLLFKIGSPVSFAFLSHKVLRWLTPFFMILSFILSLILGLYNNCFFIVAGLQLAGLLSPLLKSIPPFRMISHFYLMNLALLKGFFVFRKGVQSSIWEPTRRDV